MQNNQSPINFSSVWSTLRDYWINQIKEIEKEQDDEGARSTDIFEKES